jgi:hypothetical protein
MDPEHSGWIRTPAFEDFFDDGFLDIDKKSNYQPLNNATEIALAQEESDIKADDDEVGETPTPHYRPRKTIALTPAMVEIVLENQIDNFNGIINGIREYAWQKVRTFKKESCKPYVERIYYTLQALWAHGQSFNSNDASAASTTFHCDPSKLAEITTSEWAIEKTKSITDSLAVADGKLKVTWKNEDDSYSQGGSDYDNDSGEKKTNKREQSETFVVDFLANIINKASNRESSTADTTWAFKAIRLASSITQNKRVSEVSKGLQEIMKYPAKNAREIIAHDINLRRRAQFRIDKTMAGHMRASTIFRLDPELPGNMSFFHCFPRDAFESQDIISGEELETRVKAKAISGSVVNKMYEQKLGLSPTRTCW